MSRCIRSCAPLSCGHPGRPRSRPMPSASHQADNRLNPSNPWLLANGGPLSLRIAPGRPCRSKSRSKQLLTLSVREFSRTLISSNMRLYSSRTVSGSTRSPSRSFHQPLKSTVQISLGACAFIPVARRLPGSRLRRLRGSVNPARSKTRLKLLSLGTSPMLLRSYKSRILRGPQRGCAVLSRTIAHTTSSESSEGWPCGFLLSSCKPPKPRSRKRCFHL